MKRTIKNPARKIQVEHQLIERLAHLAVPELSERFELISFTRIQLAPDLKSGVVWVTAAPAVVPDDVINACTARLSSWRRALRAELSLRYFPNLTFRYDAGQAESLHIESLLEQQ